MAQFKYKNISERVQSISGVGVVEAGATFVVGHFVNNPNFELQFDGDDMVGVEARPEVPTKKTRKGHKK